jgi:hypothetical protein
VRLMKNIATLVSALLLAGAAFAQEQTAPPSSDEVALAASGKVTITSKGTDVRSVLYDLFSQTGRNFVLEPNVRFVLYLHLKEVEFDEALAIVLKTSGLKQEKQNGISFITARKPGEVDPKPQPSREAAAPERTVAPRAPLGKLTPADLQKRITTRFKVTDLAVVLRDFGRQAGVKIELGEGLPNVKIDAFLIDTSLKFALDSVCDAVGLKYTLTEDKGILIEKKA